MGKIVQSKELVAELWGLGVPELRLPRDPQVYCPSFAWLKEFAKWLSQNQIPYQKHKADCDKQTTRAMYYAWDALYRNPEVKNCGYGFGWCEIDLRNGSLNAVSGAYHETLIVRVDDGRWFLLEPQNGLYEEFQGATANYPAPSYVRL